MRHGDYRTHFLRLVGAGLALLAVCPALASPQDAKTQAPAKADETPIGWGQERDGLQVGIFLLNGQEVYHYGDQLSFVLRVRNVSKETINLPLKSPNYLPLSLGPKNTINLSPSPGDTIDFHLAPGDVDDLPNSEFHVTIVPPGEAFLMNDREKTTLFPLVPGKYQIQSSIPLWLAAPKDEHTATGHHVRAGAANFVVLDEARPGARLPQNVRPRLPFRIATPDRNERGGIQWGDIVNGLQGGLALAEDKRRYKVGDTLSMDFYVRNMTNRPLTISYPNFRDYDWAPMVQNDKGEGVRVMQVFVSGLRSHSEHLLLPGERFQIGHTTLTLDAEMQSDADKGLAPHMAAKPGRYTISLVDSVRFAGMERFDMALVTGSAWFAINEK